MRSRNNRIRNKGGSTLRRSKRISQGDGIMMRVDYSSQLRFTSLYIGKSTKNGFTFVVNQEGILKI